MATYGRNLRFTAHASSADFAPNAAQCYLGLLFLQGSYPAAGLCAKDFACSLRYQPEFLCPSGSKHSSSVHRHSGEPYNMLQIVSPNFTCEKVHRFDTLLQVGALSTAAGAGGGALFVPLFNSLLQFSKSWHRCTQRDSLTSALCSTDLPLTCLCRRQGLSSNLASNHHWWSYRRCLRCLVSDAPTASRQTAHTV